MSNVRPWFRLSSIARPTSQGSSDPPPPPPPRQTPRRPVVVRPPAKQPSPPRQQQPPSPPRQQTPPPPPPQERSPYNSPPRRHMSPPTPPKAKSPPPPPPRSSYTPPPSPKEVQEALPPRKPTSPPSPAHSTHSIKSDSESPRKGPSPRVLSPYSLPPSQLHSERETTQKNILTAEKTSQLHEQNHHNQNYNHNHSQNQNHNNQGYNTKKTHQQPPFSESENIMGTRVITIAGENKGAVMEILRSPSSNKTGGSGTHSRVLNSAGEKGRRLQSSSSSSSDEGEGKKKTTKNPNKGNHSNLPMKAFMNSNVQMINNSIVYNSTATHHDPGVHLKISRKPGSGNGFHFQDYGNGGYTN
uniref:Uncharacterized protein n=1 Tax=Noccaea caerulescens TaxID=107243 RepID=A0A1J3ICQ6_NOCCA